MSFDNIYCPPVKQLVTRFLVLLLVCVFALSQYTTVLALSPEQKRLFDSGVRYYNADGCTSSDSESLSQPTTDATGPVYILGDSIAVATENDYKAAFSGKEVYVDGSTSRSLNGRGIDGNGLTGMAAIAADSEEIKKASNVVIALGTNGGTNASSIGEAIQAIKKINKNAKIFWVDTISVGREDGYNGSVIGPANRAIYNNAGSTYSVISWFKAVNPKGDPKNPTAKEADPNGYINNSDGLGVHTSDKGSKALAELVAKTVNGGGSLPTTTTGCCAAGGAQLTGDTNGIQAYNYFVDKGLSPAGASGIIGNMTIESVGVEPQRLQNHITERIPPEEIPANERKAGYGIVQWTPADEKILKLRPLSKAGELSGQLDYLWDELTNGYKSVVDKLKSADSPEAASDTFLYDFEKPADPGASVATRQAYARAYFNLATKGTQLPTDVPVSRSAAGGPANSGGGSSPESSSGTGCAGGSNGAAFVLDDYAWPVDISKTELDSGYPWPCKGNCHHDRTPAFDLSTRETVRGGNDGSATGKAVFAISDGTVSNLHIYEGIAGCYIFQLTSSKDDYMYAYIHVRNPNVQNGDEVSVGQKLAEIGERKCTANGSYPHLHLDRGSPKGAVGGYPGSRDSGLVEILNKLHENLPND